jgi:Xaa-Pro aminopeptidase
MPEWRLADPGPADAAPGDPAETRAKLQDLRGAMAAAGLDAVYLQRWANVAWLCGGRGNRVVLDSPEGACGVLVTASEARLLAPDNEAARCREEAFAGLPLPIVTRAWTQLPLWTAAPGLLPRHAGGGAGRGSVAATSAAVDGEAAEGGASAVDGPRWASDVRADGARDAEPLMAPLRRRLREPEMARYRALGREAAEGLESALLEAEPRWQEIHVAAAIAAELRAREIEAPVILVGGLPRVMSYRHFVPTPAPVGGGLVASVTAVRHGLHASLTRALAFGEVGAERREWHHAATFVDATMLDRSRPGATLGEVFEAGERAYAARGYYDEWREHHQGGTTGYAGREVFALPGSPGTLEAGVAVAWNPTVPGAKSEDTALVHDGGIELLTVAPGSRWPLVHPEGLESIPRPGILVL